MKYDETTGRYELEDSDVEIAKQGHTDQTRPFKIILVLIGLSMAALLIFMGWVFLSEAITGKRDKAECTEKVDAEVIDYKVSTRKITHTDNDGDWREEEITEYTAVFRFYYNGTYYTVESGEASVDREFRVGEKILLMIDPDDPNRVYAKQEDKTLRNIVEVLVFLIMFFGILFGVPFIKSKISRTNAK